MIAVTLGDPAGIGPEVVLSADRSRDRAARGLDDRRRSRRARARGRGLRHSPPSLRGVTVRHLDALHGGRVVPGKLDAACGRAAVSYVREATDMCLRREAIAMVTAPVSKEAVALSDSRSPATPSSSRNACGSHDSRMMLTNPRLSVVHVSTHMPLRDAVDVRPERITRTIVLAAEAMRWLGNEAPRIAVCGMNPHASEHGLFGREERNTISPAIEAAKAHGVLCHGPFPPDTIFLDAWQGKWDVVIAMYHDQGHIPMKLPRLQAHRQRDARHPDRAHVGRSRHGLRHRGRQPRRSHQHDRRLAPGRDDRPRAASNWPDAITVLFQCTCKIRPTRGISDV